MAAVVTCVLHYVTGRFSARVQEICSLRTTGRLVRKVSWSLSWNGCCDRSSFTNYSVNTRINSMGW